MAVTAASSTGAAVFSASGLASGMDTNSITDQLVALESRPITLLQNQQAAMKTQVSSLAAIAAKLSALSTAADDLGQNGLFASKASSANVGFTAAPATGAVPGRYAVSVEQMARAAKWRSAGFATGETMAGGTLALTVQGKAYDPVTIQDGASLADVAYAIRQSGAPVSAVVLNDGTRSYLSITNQDTGFPLDGTAADALDMAFTPVTGAVGTLPGFADLGDPNVPGAPSARNAVVVVDGLRFTRTSNTISDALPGTTLTLTKENPGQAEDLVLSSDPDATQKRLQTFVDAYNGVMSLVRKQTNVTADTDRSTSLVGFSSIRSLQGQLQQVLVSKVPGLATVRTLADLGLKTSKDDGSLSIDATVLQRALARDPSAVNALFSTAVTGVSKLVDGLVDRNTRSVDGALVVSQDSLNGRVTQITSQIESMQRRVDAYRATLLAQFTAMETMVSGLKNMGTFLTSWASQGTKSS